MTSWSSYHQYMSFSDDDLRARYRRYASMFDGLSPVADLGCGNGVFLELIRDGGAACIGVDADAKQVEACRSKGLEAEVGDAIGWITERDPASLGGVFSSHVVEHMGAGDVAELARGCHVALRPGGIAVIVTPNPEALHAHLLEFWRDPTHVRMYSKEALGYLFWSAGFEIEEARDNPDHNTGTQYMTNALRPGRWWTKLLMKPVERRLDRVLAPLGLDKGNELYVVARKPS